MSYSGPPRTKVPAAVHDLPPLPPLPAPAKHKHRRKAEDHKKNSQSLQPDDKDKEIERLKTVVAELEKRLAEILSFLPSMAPGGPPLLPALIALEEKGNKQNQELVARGDGVGVEGQDRSYSEKLRDCLSFCCGGPRR